MNMAGVNWLARGRRLRSARSMRSRYDNDDDFQLDLTKDPAQTTRDVLLNLCKKQGLTEGKRFAYLDALVKLLSKRDENYDLGFSVEDVLCCLRIPLIHEASQVRAAALQAVRYLLKEEKHVKCLYRLQYPYIISRCLDVNLRNGMERVQALRLVRRMLALAPSEFPATIVRSLVSLANGGAEEKDQMLRACLATLAEICVLNPEVFITCGGVSAISRNILTCQMPRICEALCGVLLFLLNHPTMRNRAGISLSAFAAPYCDLHTSSRICGSHKDDREMKFNGSRMAILSVLRSLPGILHFCHPDNPSGFQAIVNILYIKQHDVRKAILELLYEVIGLNQPDWTDEFNVALAAIDPSRPQPSWKLSEGFVAAEGKALLPHLSKYRPNLSENHLSLLLYIFIEMGLLEAIVEVLITSDMFISVRATILLGQLLHLVHTLLPPGCCNITPALPNLLQYAANSQDKKSQQQALAAVAALHRLHKLLRRQPAPSSLFLDQLLQSSRRATLRPSQALLKDGDEILRESAVLANKDGFAWNWTVVRAILRSRISGLKKLEDSNYRTFVRRLVHYFKPSSNRFSRVELGNRHQTHIYSLAGCELIDCLLEADEPEGGRLLMELLTDIWQHIDAITTSKSAHDCLFSPQNVLNTLCQYYFLFIGRFSHSSKGLRWLDKAGILQQLLNLVGNTNHECYVKLVVSCLDYSLDGVSRVILNKVLTATSEPLRLYATQLMLVLLRAHVQDFHKWGIEMLVMQLYDQAKAVSLAAINVLMEACEEKIYLEAVINLRPSLLHLGDKGLLLLIRFLSVPAGFMYLQEANFVSHQLERWATVYNYRYVGLVEGELHDSLTLHQRGEDGRYVRRVSNLKHVVRDVFVQPHLYGQLAQHEQGFQMLLREAHLNPLFQIIQACNWSTDQAILELKAALWCCGHLGSSPAGVAFLAEEGVIVSMVNVAENCPVYTVRGTAFYVLVLLATTFQGANELRKAGWLCVRHDRHDRWPVVEEEIDSGDDGDSLSISSSEYQQRFYIADEDPHDGSEDDEAMSFNVPSLFNTQRKQTQAPQRQKSQTLPHWRPPRHIRSYSECKQPPMMWEETDLRLDEPNISIYQQPGVADNSFTDSSGVSSCESGLGKVVLSERLQTLSPIPSTTSLNTVKSSNQIRRSSQISCRKYSAQGSIASDVASSPDNTNTRLSHQDVQGYATLRSLNRFRLPLYSDSTTKAAEELLGFEDPKRSVSLSISARAKSLDRQFSQPMLSEFEASAPPRLHSGPSSSSLVTRAYYGSRSNIGRQLDSPKEIDENQQCYMGITLPQRLTTLFPLNEQCPPQTTVETGRRRGSASFSEMEQVVEAAEENSESSSELEESDSPAKTWLSVSSKLHHSSNTCLGCYRIRDRKISCGSYHRQRTDTESSYGGGESPLVPKYNRKYGSVSSVDSTVSLDAAGSNQPLDNQVLSKSFLRKEILKHVSRMSNPVWTKTSKQVLLQLKQKYPAAYQDVCLYSEVSRKLGSATYRLVARRFIQELFLDLTFDVLYEEPSTILNILQPTRAVEGDEEILNEAKLSTVNHLSTNHCTEMKAAGTFSNILEVDNSRTVPLNVTNMSNPSNSALETAIELKQSDEHSTTREKFSDTCLTGTSIALTKQSLATEQHSERNVLLEEVVSGTVNNSSDKLEPSKQHCLASILVSVQENPLSDYLVSFDKTLQVINSPITAGSKVSDVTVALTSSNINVPHTGETKCSPDKGDEGTEFSTSKGMFPGSQCGDKQAPFISSPCQSDHEPVVNCDHIENKDCDLLTPLVCKNKLVCDRNEIVTESCGGNIDILASDNNESALNILSDMSCDNERPAIEKVQRLPISIDERTLCGNGELRKKVPNSKAQNFNKVENCETSTVLTSNSHSSESFVTCNNSTSNRKVTQHEDMWTNKNSQSATKCPSENKNSSSFLKSSVLKSDVANKIPSLRPSNEPTDMIVINSILSEESCSLVLEPNTSTRQRKIATTSPPNISFVAGSYISPDHRNVPSVLPGSCSRKPL